MVYRLILEKLEKHAAPIYVEWETDTDDMRSIIMTLSHRLQERID